MVGRGRTLSAMKQDKIIRKYERVMHDLWVYFLRPFIIAAATILIMYFGITKVVNYVADHYFLPPEPGSEETFTLEIPSGYGVRSIAKLLEENGVISNSFVFRLFVDISNNSYKLQSGKYVFTRGMTMQEVMDQLLIGTNTVATINITIPEGWTIARIATYLTETRGLEGFTAQEFIDYAVPENFPEYWFLQGIPEERYEYGYVLQGYLFPDTYTIYVDSTPRDIMVRMLNNFSNRLSQSIIERAADLGYSLDELITFASILEREAANIEEFARCSACFTNRLARNMPLQSDATLIYALALNDEIRNSGFDITIEDTNFASAYNTYQRNGLPIGPICNPGLASILAVLEPNEDDIAQGMLYFTLNPDTGTHTFNWDYAMHLYYSELYAKRYREMQEEQQQQQQAQSVSYYRKWEIE